MTVRCGTRTARPVRNGWGPGAKWRRSGPQHVLRCSQGLPVGTTSPRVGRPAPLFLPGRIAEPVLGPGAIAESMPEAKKHEGSRTCPCTGYRRDIGCACQVVEGIQFLPWPILRRADVSWARAEQARAQCQTLQEQVAALAEAVAGSNGLSSECTRPSLTRAGRWLPGQGAGQAGREVTARQHAEAVRWRRVGRAEDRWPEGATWTSKSRLTASPMS